MNAPAHLASGCALMPAASVPHRQQAPRNRAPGGAQTVPLDCEGGRLSSEAGVGLLKDLDAQQGFTRIWGSRRSQQTMFGQGESDTSTIHVPVCAAGGPC